MQQGKNNAVEMTKLKKINAYGKEVRIFKVELNFNLSLHGRVGLEIGN